MLNRVVAGLAGVLMIGAVVHYAVMANGGYNWATSPLYGALAIGLVAGAIACGHAGKRMIGVGIVGAMLAGEGYQLIMTAERATGISEARQAPLRDALVARQKAAAAVTEAENALSRLQETPRLLSAVAAKKAADEAVRNDAAKPGCARNCRALLEQQVADAQKEVEAARAELDKTREAARLSLARARDVLSALPAAASATPLADRLSIEQWKIDLASAALLSIGANGLGALLVAFAFHARREVVAEPETIELVHATIEPTPVRRNALKEADIFAGQMLKPSDAGSVRLVDLRAAYHGWCRQNGMDPLSDAEIGPALSKLFLKAGLVPVGEGRDTMVTGIDWSQRAITKAA